MTVYEHCLNLLADVQPNGPLHSRALAAVDAVVNQLTERLSSQYIIPLSDQYINQHSIKAFKRLPSIEIIIIESLPIIEPILFNTNQQQLQQLKRCVGELEHRLSQDRDSMLEGIPFNTPSAKLKKAAMYALSISLHNRLELQAAKTNPSNTPEYFKQTIALLRECDPRSTLTDLKTFQLLCLSNYIEASIDQHPLIKDPEKANTLKKQLTHIYGNLVGKVPNNTLIAVCDLALKKSQQYDWDSLQKVLKDKTTALNFLNFAEQFKQLEKQFNQLQSHVFKQRSMQNHALNDGIHDYCNQVRAYSVAIVGNVVLQHLGLQKIETTCSNIASLQQRIHHANQSLTRIIPRRWSKTLTAILRVTACICTLGLAAFFIARHNLSRYNCFNLDNPCHSHIMVKRTSQHAANLSPHAANFFRKRRCPQHSLQRQSRPAKITVHV